MINLLPKETIRQIKAGHNNVFLIKCLLITGVATAFLVLIYIGSYIFLVSQKNIAEDSNVNTTTETGYNKPINDIDEINTSIISAEKILDQKKSYSKIILDIANILPTDMIIKNFSFSDNSSSQITLKIYSKNIDNSKLKTNFNNSSTFSEFKITSTNENQTTVSGYPVELTVTANINKGSIK